MKTQTDLNHLKLVLFNSAGIDKVDELRGGSGGNGGFFPIFSRGGIRGITKLIGFRPLFFPKIRFFQNFFLKIRKIFPKSRSFGENSQFFWEFSGNFQILGIFPETLDILGIFLEISINNVYIFNILGKISKKKKKKKTSSVFKRRHI